MRNRTFANPFNAAILFHHDGEQTGTNVVHGGTILALLRRFKAPVQGFFHVAIRYTTPIRPHLVTIPNPALAAVISLISSELKQSKRLFRVLTNSTNTVMQQSSKMDECFGKPISMNRFFVPFFGPSKILQVFLESNTIGRHCP